MIDNLALEQRKKRAKIIDYLYQFMLFNKPISEKEAFESGEFSPKEISIIENIAKAQSKLEKVIKLFLKESWPWNRIRPHEQAILIYGAYELLINDSGIVINELVTITKGYIPGDTFKLINGVLNNIGRYYEKMKNKKETKKK